MSGPTDLEAWEALQAYAPELDKVRRAKDLKEAMFGVVSRTRDMSQSPLDFVDFGVIWIDPHFRQICNKFAEIGPGRETFSIATYRTMKTSRLDGHWDVLLLNLAGWIESFAKQYRRFVTLADYERLLSCMPGSRNLKTYRVNIKSLFWSGPGASVRTEGFLTGFPEEFYEDAFNMVSANPPEDGWDIGAIMNQIHDKGIVCKSVMLHVGFWFNPNLEEPANRANVKPPMFHHLKPAFSKYHPEHPLYEADEAWKQPALVLQRVVLKFTLEWWPKNNAVIGNLGMLRDMSFQKYRDYISTNFWNSLLREVRNNTQVPFQHPSLVDFTDVDSIPVDQVDVTQAGNESRLSASRDFENILGNAIREEYSDGQDPESDEEEDNSEDGDDPTFMSNSRYSRPGSPPQEALAVESEEEEDIIHVQTPSPSYNGLPKRRRLQHMNDGLGYIPVYDEQFTLRQRPLQKIVKLKVPPRYFAALESEQELAEQRRSARKRPVTSNGFTPELFHEPSPAVSAPSRAHSHTTPASRTPVAIPEQLQWMSPQKINPGDAYSADSRASQGVSTIDLSLHQTERETARMALDAVEGRANLITQKAGGSEGRPSRPSSSSQPFRRPSNRVSPSVSRPAAATARSPAPSPAPHSLSHRQSLTRTPLPASPALMTNKTEEAVEVLQDEYGDVLQIKEMVAAIKFLRNDLEAGIFLRLRAGPVRDAWLLDGVKEDIKED